MIVFLEETALGNVLFNRNPENFLRQIKTKLSGNTHNFIIGFEQVCLFLFCLKEDVKSKVLFIENLTACG